MGRIAELDLPERLAPYMPAWVVQLLFALFCTGVATALRAVIDAVSPGAGPFAIGFPATLLATLFARWQAGALTAALTILYSWYFVLPPDNSFALNPGDGGRVAVAALAYGAIVAIADGFRVAVRQAQAERNRQLAERDLMLEEFDHRVKNNFALVASLLDMQRRRAKDEGTAQALGSALARIESIARAHRHLYRGAPTPGTIDMAAYLGELCSALSEALFLRAALTLDCDSDSVQMPRDRAVSIGLILNELVTNAAKHAFEGRAAGTIQVRFRATESGWRLTVADNGHGIPADKPVREGALGQRLVEAFAKQAGGTIATESGPGGTTITVEFVP
jgi:two-component sensor histidine kinase